MNSKLDFFSTNNDVANLLSARVKNERIFQELKQSELAEMADVKLHVIRNFEQHSKISLDNLISIIRALKKLGIFEDMFDFEQERIDIDAFKYIDDAKKKAKKRVRDAKQ